MEVTGGQELVVWNKDHQAQQAIKGKRTKRSRLPSPLRLSMASSCSSAGGRASTDDHSGGSSSVVDMATTSTDQLRVSTEEEDMANCLILLAQGHNTHHEPSSHNNDDKASSGMYLYQCKTCDRCFPSFQALGGHRASHKKTKPNNSEEKLQSVTFANEEAHHHQPYDPTGTSFVLSLQISNSSHNNTNNKSKVHECSICGAEFTSGQALGGHMRRHRTLVNNSAATTCTGNNNSQPQPTNKPATKNVLKLDLNLPAPEDDHRESKLPFQSKENVLVFSASSLVDCHY